MDKNSKILTGCGIGCGAVVVILIIIGIIGYNFISEKVEKIEEFEIVIKDLEEKYNQYDDFYPVGDQLLSEERMSVFLEIRDSIKLRSGNFTASLESISDKIENEGPDQQDDSFSGLMDMISTGFSAIPQIANYFTYRHKLLETDQMSIGEYYYYYVMSYYLAMNVDLGDGPHFPVPGNSDGASYNFNDEKNKNPEEFINEVREKRTDQISAKVNIFMTKVLKNFLENNTSNDKELIEKEIEIMEKNKYALPFADSKPQFLVSFFEKYKDRLEQNYVDMLNPLELNPLKVSKKRKRPERKQKESENY